MGDHDASSGSAAVTALEAAYGAPSQAGFGSAIFTEASAAGDDLEEKAKAWYEHFLGDQWASVGEAAWMGPWKEVRARPAGATPDIVAELRATADPDAAVSVPMILDNLEGADQARVALAAVYDDPAITELRVFNLGDGGAMSASSSRAVRDPAGTPCSWYSCSTESC